MQRDASTENREVRSVAHDGVLAAQTGRRHLRIDGHVSPRGRRSSPQPARHRHPRSGSTSRTGSRKPRDGCRSSGPSRRRNLAGNPLRRGGCRRRTRPASEACSRRRPGEGAAPIPRATVPTRGEVARGEPCLVANATGARQQVGHSEQAPSPMVAAHPLFAVRRSPPHGGSDGRSRRSKPDRGRCASREGGAPTVRGPPRRSP